MAEPQTDPAGTPDETTSRPTGHAAAHHTTAERDVAAPQQPEAGSHGAAEPQTDPAGTPDETTSRPTSHTAAHHTTAERDVAAPHPDGHPVRPAAGKPGTAEPRAEHGPVLVLAPAHAAPHRRPQVTVTVRAGGGELLLRVGDTGPGVAAEAVDEVFRRGWSTKSPGPAPHGRGLGLALVRQAARRNGGTVTVGESPAGGAEFTVRLPLLAPASAPTPAQPTAEAAPGATA
ncbi:sensor histidine kinase [Streptomyces netropsis]|uniref:sensor histidine kinase n=1 Tax=Streptomyces netropsis TaxID=55404 RepID=UPI0037A2811D